MAEIIKMNENTWRIEDGGVRCFLLEGKDKALLIDSGMTLPDARTLAEGVTSLPLELLNTHADPDHISGNAAFDRCYMHPEEEAAYRQNKGTGTVVPVKDGDVLDLGDRPLRIIHIPGHTPGSIAILDEKARVLISGDSVQGGGIFMFGEGRDMRKFAESMKHLAEYADRFDTVYPSHGSIPLEADLVGKLEGAAKEIQAGKASGEYTDLFGHKVWQYKFPFAGFFCEPPKE